MQEWSQYPGPVSEILPEPVSSPQIVPGNDGADIFLGVSAGVVPEEVIANNALAFPGVFRGALDAGARKITESMKVAEAICSVVGDDRAPDRIVLSPLDPRVGRAVASAIAAATQTVG